MKCSIRLMGDKDLTYKLAKIIKNALEQNGYSVEFKEYNVYVDKRNRNVIDNERIRLYANITE